MVMAVGAWYSLTARKPMQTPFAVWEGGGGYEKNKKYGKLMVEPTWSEWKAAFNTFPLGGGKKHLDKDPWKGEFALTVKRAAFPPQPRL